MGDKSKKTLEVPSRKPLKFTPKIPPRKKANPEITDKKPLDEAENIVDKELLRRLKLSHEGSESKSAKIPTSKMDLYHPVTLPWSDNSDPVPDEEFSEASASPSQDEDCIKPAEELDLLKESEKTRMLFFQLPQSLPFVKLPAVAGRREIEGPTSALEKNRGLQMLPAGYMGKMMVYKSGNVKMKLGDTLFDVSPGVKCAFPQDVAAINTKEKHCCIIGNIDKNVVVTPDLDSLLDGITN